VGAGGGSRARLERELLLHRMCWRRLSGLPPGGHALRHTALTRQPDRPLPNPSHPSQPPRCSQIGNLREDIKACKHIAEAAPGADAEDPAAAGWAGRQLGLHYLKRYFLLISYRAFLEGTAEGATGAPPAEARPASAGGGAGAAAGAPTFVRWMEERRELGHLLAHLSLET
jgi:hypothetical protein